MERLASSLDLLAMRLVTPATVLVFVVVWTLVFLGFARYYLFSAHEVSCMDMGTVPARGAWSNTLHVHVCMLNY